MNTFVEIPTNDQSIHTRKLVLGMGINDADYITQPTVDGKQISCPFYQRWQGMITRAYSPRYKREKPTYEGVTVCKEWLTFSNFKRWMEKQDWEGKELDKDIIISGNKKYSPESCRFVSLKLNRLLSTCAARRGNLPQGVHFNTNRGKYKVMCNVDGKARFLGHFTSVKMASLVYRRFKANLISEIAFEQTDEQIERGLMLHAGLILNDF